MQHLASKYGWLLWLGCLVIAGRVTIDLQIGEGIPISAQTIAVLLTGYFLRYDKLVLLYLVYLLGGSILDLPFFADGTHGVSVLMGKTGGYLYSFPLAAAYMQYHRQKGCTRALSWLMHSLVATAIILVIGLLHLSLHIGIEKAWLYGVLPFLAGGIVKAAIVTALISALTRFATHHVD